MRSFVIKPGDLIPIGRAGENQATEIRFDVTGWAETFGAGTYTLVVKRPHEDTAYPVEVTTDGDYVVWTVSNVDTGIAGNASVQLRYVVDGALAKSVIYTGIVGESLDNIVDPPDPFEDLIQRMVDLTERTEAAAESAAGSAASASESAGTTTAAKTAAQTAAQAAQTAQGTATQAAQTATQAKDAAQAAQQAAEVAQSAAASSATAASGSATAAAGSATEAAASATAANASATAAAASAATLTLDATLTSATQAAQAKATGDELTKLKSALNYDIEGFGESLGFYPIPPTGDGWIPCNKAVGETINLSDVRTSSAAYRYRIVPCTEGDKFTITAVGGTTTVRLFAFLDSSDTVLYITAKQTTSLDGYVFTAPANTAKALIQDNGGNTQYFYTPYNVKTRFEALESADVSFVKEINNSITVTSSATTSYPFTVGKSFLVTNNSDASISFRTRLSPSSSNVELMTVNAGLRKVFNCTLPADGINIYTAGSSINVTVQQMDTLEYRTTDNTQRIEALESDGVPSYFRTMMDTKLPQIRANMNETGRNGDSFVFITDMHWDRNAKHSPGLIRYILNNTNINKVLCGGDLISQGERNAMMQDMIDAIHSLEYSFHKNLLVAFGNHDSNKMASNPSTEHFDLNACYALMEKEAESYITMMTNYDLSFYYDNNANKTRYIVLDMGEDSGDYGRVFTAYQEFADTLLDTPQDWKIIVVGHIVTYGRFAYLGAMMDAYNAKTTYTRQDVGTFDFTGADATVVCCFGGHTHIDSDFTTTGGIPVIVTTTDSGRTVDGDLYPYTAGTDQEQAFDVVTIDYMNETIKCVRIGRGADRTITY